MNHSDIKRYIIKHIADIEGPEDLAENLNLSYSTLRKEFRNKEKQTLGNFINSVKVKKAQQLLKSKDLYIYEIAYEVGFQREETAMRVFKRHTGITMSEYRENCS